MAVAAAGDPPEGFFGGGGIVRGSMNTLAPLPPGGWDVVQAGNAATGTSWGGSVYSSGTTSQATYASATDVLAK